MMRSLLLFLLAIPLPGADDTWGKVRELASGTELRIYKKAAREPLLVKLDEATDERLVVVMKNEQVSIPREQIERIDYRPPRRGSRFVKETKTKTEVNEVNPPAIGPGQTPRGPSSSSSTSFSVQPKPDFETIYRRTAVGGQKSPQ